MQYKNTKKHNQKSQLTIVIDINFQRIIFRGNNQVVLLEQLEKKGIHIPYSCRSGICGVCKMKLKEGKVKVLKKSVVTSDGLILCCSCIPKTSLKLEI